MKWYFFGYTEKPNNKTKTKTLKKPRTKTPKPILEKFLFTLPKWATELQ